MVVCLLTNRHGSAKVWGGGSKPRDVQAGTALFSYGGGRAPNAASSWQVVVGSMASGKAALSLLFQ